MKTASQYKIVIADDHLLIREMIKKSIAEVPGMAVIGEAGDGLELLVILEKVIPDLVLLDLTMPNLQGLDALKQIRELYPGVKVLVLTMHKSKQHISRALSAGANGYLLKENAFDDLLVAIDRIRRGERYISNLLSDQITELFLQKDTMRGGADQVEPLSAREREVLDLILEGKSAREIADSLTISIMTVYNHRINIKKKLGIRKDVDLIKYGIRKGYLLTDQ
ncbi:MAG: response regulator transcription factor [Syntrophobacteraceae bacterium]